MRQNAAEFLGTFWLVLGGWAMAQLWLFWLAPIAGALLGAGVHRFLTTPTVAGFESRTPTTPHAGHRASANA